MKAIRLPRIVDPLILASIGLFAFYMLWVAARPEQVFWSLDEGGKYIHLQSILQTKRIDTPLVYPAESIDPEHKFVPLFYFFSRDGKLYSWWSINLALVSLPFYQTFGWIGLYLLPAVAGAMCAYLAGAILRKLSNSVWLALAATCLTGLTTPVTFYSTMFWEHTLSTGFCLASLYILLLSLENRSVAYGFLAGMLASVSVFFRLEVLPVLTGFGIVLLFKSLRQSVWFAIGTIITSIPWLILNQITSGHPLGPTFALVSKAGASSGFNQLGLKFIPFALFNPPRADAFVFSRPLLAIVSLLLVTGILTVWLRRTALGAVVSFAGVTAISAWVVLQSSQYQAVHGIVLVSPHILLGVYLFTSKQLWKESPYPKMLLAALILLTAVYIRQAWVAAGGLQWGPRYLLIIYPLMIIAALQGLWYLMRTQEQKIGKWAVLTFICGCLVGLGFELRGIITARKLMEFYARSIPVFANVTDAPIVLTWEGYAMDVSPLYWQGNVVSLSSDKPDWDLWNQHARELGLNFYYTAKLLTVDNAPLDLIEKRLQEHPSGVIIQKVPVPP